jgi:hypothetical protein
MPPLSMPRAREARRVDDRHVAPRAACATNGSCLPAVAVAPISWRRYKKPEERGPDRRLPRLSPSAPGKRLCHGPSSQRSTGMRGPCAPRAAQDLREAVTVRSRSPCRIPPAKRLPGWDESPRMCGTRSACAGVIRKPTAACAGNHESATRRSRASARAWWHRLPDAAAAAPPQGPSDAENERSATIDLTCPPRDRLRPRPRAVAR